MIARAVMAHAVLAMAVLLVAGAAGSAAAVSDLLERHVWHMPGTPPPSASLAAWPPPPPPPPHVPLVQPAPKWNATYNAATQEVVQPLDQVVVELTASLAADNRILAHLSEAIKIATAIESREAMAPYPHLSAYWFKTYSSLVRSAIAMVVRYTKNLKKAYAVEKQIKNGRASALEELKAIVAVSQRRSGVRPCPSKWTTVVRPSGTQRCFVLAACFAGHAHRQHLEFHGFGRCRLDAHCLGQGHAVHQPGTLQKSGCLRKGCPGPVQRKPGTLVEGVEKHDAKG